MSSDVGMVYEPFVRCDNCGHTVFIEQHRVVVSKNQTKTARTVDLDKTLLNVESHVVVYACAACGRTIDKEKLVHGE